MPVNDLPVTRQCIKLASRFVVSRTYLPFGTGMSGSSSSVTSP